MKNAVSYMWDVTVIDVGGKGIHKSIKKNELPLFSTPKAKKASNKAQKLSDLRDDVALFGHLLIPDQLRDGDPDVFVKTHFVLPLFPIMENYGQAKV